MRTYEAFRVADIRLVQHLLTLFDNFFCLTVVQRLRGEQGDAAVMVVLVVPREELLAKRYAHLRWSRSGRGTPAGI